MADPLRARTIIPMKGKLGELPRGEQWLYEIKWDGMRVVAFITGEHVRLQSANGNDVTVSFPELQALTHVSENFDGVVLDGEVVAFDGATPSFTELQNRMHVTDPADAARRSQMTPVIFVAFDLLHLDGHDTMALPLEDRRSLLEQLADDRPGWTICEQHHDDVDALMQAVRSADLEGIVAKRRGSTYQAGKRTSDWIKIKHTKHQEFVVGGWLSGQGTRATGVGSLLLGYYDDQGLLQCAGRAGSGLDDAQQVEWLDVLAERSTCPFATIPDTPRDRLVHWCEPDHVVEIKYGEWPAGKQVRHPVVLGRRTDKDPRTITREV